MIVKEVQSLLISLGESQAVDAEILVLRQWENDCFGRGVAPTDAQLAAYLAGRRGAIRTPVKSTPCGCKKTCGDDGDIDGPGSCQGLPRPPLDPVVEMVLITRAHARKTQ